MGYGGSAFNGTLSVDLVQTDVQAIVDGICGYAGQTLSNVHDTLNGIYGLLYNGNSAADYLGWINDHLNYQNNTLFYDWYSYRTAIEVLVSMESILNDIRNNTNHY